MAMIGKVRRMFHRQNKSVRELSRITSLSRNTISKWLEEPLEGEPKSRPRPPRPGKLTDYHATLKQALQADAHRPKKERRTALALFAEIQAAGYTGGYSRVTDFVRAWRQGEGQGGPAKAFVPLSFTLGEAYQFDVADGNWTPSVADGYDYPVAKVLDGNDGGFALKLNYTASAGWVTNEWSIS